MVCNPGRSLFSSVARRFFWAGMVAAVSAASPCIAAGFERPDGDSLIVTLEPGRHDVPAEGARTSLKSLAFEAWGKRFEMDLDGSGLFSPGAKVHWTAADGRRWSEPPRSQFLAGELRGRPGSKVRVRLDGDSIEGFILDGEESYFLEPARLYFAGATADEAVIRRFSTAGFWEEARRCGVDLLPPAPPRDGLDARAGDIRRSESAGTGEGLHEVELRLVVDSYYANRHGVSAADRVHAVIHEINPIFETEFGVTLKISETSVSLDPSQDGVGPATDPTRLLEEFGRSEPLHGSDLAHLFTGRRMGEETLGLAWMGTVCDPRYGVGVTQDLESARARLVTTAHELAHSLGARHDGRGYCSSVGSGWIMWPTLNVAATSFSECSRKLVSLNLPRFDCVSRLDPESPLPAPRPISPVGVSSQRVRFEWESVEGASGYALEVIDEDTTQSVLEGTVAETSLQPALSFTLGHRYRWRVGTVREGSVTARTEWQSFTVTGWRRLGGR